MPEWLKQDVVGLTGLSRDALHIHIGLGLMLAAAALLHGQRLVRAWLLVLVVELFNEGLELSEDLLHPWNGDWVGSVHDIVNTMIWPTFILAASAIGFLRIMGPRGSGPVSSGRGPTSEGKTGTLASPAA